MDAPQGDDQREHRRAARRDEQWRVADLFDEPYAGGQREDRRNTDDDSVDADAFAAPTFAKPSVNADAREFALAKFDADDATTDEGAESGSPWDNAFADFGSAVVAVA